MAAAARVWLKAASAASFSDWAGCPAGDSSLPGSEGPGWGRLSEEAVVAWLLYIRPFDWLALRRRWAGIWRPLADKLYVDQAYELFTVNLGGAFAAFLARNVDQRGIDGHPLFVLDRRHEPGGDPVRKALRRRA